MATNFFELATTLKNLGAKWLSEKKVNFMPWVEFWLTLHVRAVTRVAFKEVLFHQEKV